MDSAGCAYICVCERDCIYVHATMIIQDETMNLRRRGGLKRSQTAGKTGRNDVNMPVWQS